MVLADPGFACQKPKIPPMGIWCPCSEKLGIIKPYSSHVPLSVLHNPQADKWYGGQTQLSWTYAWGKLEMGQGCPAVGNPKPNIWPSTDVHGEEKTMILHLIKKKVNQPSSQKHKAILPFRHCLSILPIGPALPVARGLKSGKEATSAEQDVEGCGEEESYKQTYSNIESEGREGRGVRGTEAGAQKGKQQLVQRLRK